MNPSTGILRLDRVGGERRLEWYKGWSTIESVFQWGRLARSLAGSPAVHDRCGAIAADGLPKGSAQAATTRQIRWPSEARARPTGQKGFILILSSRPS